MLESLDAQTRSQSLARSQTKVALRQEVERLKAAKAQAKLARQQLKAAVETRRQARLARKAARERRAARRAHKAAKLELRLARAAELMQKAWAKEQRKKEMVEESYRKEYLDEIKEKLRTNPWELVDKQEDLCALAHSRVQSLKRDVDGARAVMGADDPETVVEYHRVFKELISVRRNWQHEKIKLRQYLKAAREFDLKAQIKLDAEIAQGQQGMLQASEHTLLSP